MDVPESFEVGQGRICGPTGHESLARPGFTLGTGLRSEALKGRPLTRRRGTSREIPVAPSGLLTFRMRFPG